MSRKMTQAELIRRRARKRNRDTDQRSDQPAPAAPAGELADALELLDRGEFSEAAPLLEKLYEQNPQCPETLRALVVAYRESRNPRLLRAVSNLEALEPNAPDVDNEHLQALIHFDLSFLVAARIQQRAARFRPSQDSAKRADVDEFVASAHESAARLGLRFDDAVVYDEIRMAMLVEEFDRAVDLAAQLTGRCPDFAAARNNHAESLFQLNRLDEAIAITRETLERRPTDGFAHAILARYLFLRGEEDEARGIMRRLMQDHPTHAMNWQKAMETWSVIGDDAEVLAAFAAAEGDAARSEETLSPSDLGYIDYMAAVAHLRLRQPAEARGLLVRASKHRFDPAVQELAKASLHFDASAVHGNAWLPWLLTNYLLVLGRGDKKKMNDADLLHAAEARCSYLGHILPAILERGDLPVAYVLAHLAFVKKEPQHIEAVRRFALGQRGTDTIRMTLFQRLVRSNLIESHRAKLWVADKWSEQIAYSWDVHCEPAPTGLPPEAEARLLQCQKLLQLDEPVKAEALLRELLAEYPGHPTISNNLSAALSRLGRGHECRRLMEEVHARYPDYLFARANLAPFLAGEGRFDEAQALLAPLYDRRRMHISELTALLTARVEIELYRGALDTAESWLRTLEGTRPDAPPLPMLRRKLAAAQALERTRRG